MFQFVFRWRKGRCRGRRLREVYISYIPQVKVFKPDQEFCEDVVTLNFAEFEAVRLVDYENLNFDEAAEKMGVSKATVWRFVKSARRKIAEALVEGKILRIEEGGRLERFQP
jgi:predicted DNA-binding protein (UPF0251 family)